MTEKVALFDDSNTQVGEWEKLAVLSVTDCPKIKKDRERKIIFDRFGIGKNIKTLNAIGNQYGVTRERIRQIVNNVLKKIKKFCKNDKVNNTIKSIEEFVNKSGGYISNIDLYSKYTKDSKREQNAIRFIATLSENLDIVKESNYLKEGLVDKKVKEVKLKKIVVESITLLKKQGKTLRSKEIAETINYPEDITRAALSGAKAIMKGDDNKWGLKTWPHVNPKSIKDKSMYILKRYSKPIHYTELTIKISELSNKKVTKQSVHNELIKNSEFVLVGRGIYALSEWGYTPGVVEEVIVQVLIEAGKPMHKNEIIDLVLERRIVKASTVILNLQKPRFKRVKKAVYTLN